MGPGSCWEACDVASPPIEAHPADAGVDAATGAPAHSPSDSSVKRRASAIVAALLAASKNSRNTSLCNLVGGVLAAGSLDRAMPLFVAVLRRSPGGMGVKVARTLTSDLFLRDASPKCLSTYMGLWPRHLTQYLCFGSSSLEQQRRLSLVTAPVNPAAECEGEVNPYGFSTPGGGRPLEVIGAPEQVEMPAAAAKAATPKKVSLHGLRQKYLRHEPLSMITAYDYLSARVADGAGADMLLVGDSLGMVVLGQEDTTEVTISQMVHHCQAAGRGTQRAFLVADLPFGSYLTPDQAARNGVRLIKEGRADAVKLEGGMNVVRQVREAIFALPCVPQTSRPQRIACGRCVRHAGLPPLTPLPCPPSSHADAHSLFPANPRCARWSTRAWR